MGLQDLQKVRGKFARAKTMVIGGLSGGILISPQMKPTLLEGPILGLDLASGQHNYLGEEPDLSTARNMVTLIDVFEKPTYHAMPTGKKRTGKTLPLQ